MNVATIVPEHLLDYTTNNDYFMCLAHLVDGKNNYTKFFQQRVAEGKFVLMDNGAAENAQVSLDDLLDKIDIIKPTEVVLPDVLLDTDKTLAQYQVALHAIKKRFGDSVRVMAVPQGKNLYLWARCAKEFIDNPLVDSIGVSKFLLNATQNMNARVRAVELIKNMATRSVDIHILGCGDNPVEIGYIASLYDIRGCDSAAAYVYSKAGLVIAPTVKRPEHPEINFLAKDELLDEDLLSTNIKRWRYICGG
jgi:hypothetical protein